MQCDGNGPHKWSPTASKTRHMDLDPTSKLQFFVSLFTEFAASPLIDNGEHGHAELLVVLSKVGDEIDAANDIADDEADEELFEAVMCRVRGVIALTSRIHGNRKSTKQDAMTIRQEADVGGSSLYTKLTNQEFYRTLVAEYWQTIDQCEVRVPELRKRTRQLNRVGRDTKFEASLVILQDALTYLNESKARIRPTQADDVEKALTTAVDGLASYVALNVTTEQWVKDKCQDLNAILTQTSDEVAQTDVVNLARAALQSMQSDAKTVAAHAELVAAVSGVVQHVKEATFFVEIDANVIGKVRADATANGSLDEAEGAFLVDAIKTFCATLHGAAEPDAKIVSMKFVQSFESMVLFCTTFFDKLKKPNMPELWDDIQALLTLIDPLKAMLGYVLLGPDAQGRVQKDAMRTVAASAHAGYQQLLSLVGGGDDTYGLVKQYRDEFLTIFDEAAELGLKLLSTSLQDADKKLKKLKRIVPFGDPAKLHWLDECDANPADGDVDLDIVIDFCNETLFKIDPSAFNKAMDNHEAAMKALTLGCETFGKPIPEIQNKAQDTFDDATLTKKETGLIGVVAQCKGKPMKLKRSIAEIYATTPAAIIDRFHPLVVALVDDCAPNVAKKAKLADPN